MLAALAAVIVVIGGGSTMVGSADAVAPPTPAGWTQTFLDDFNGSSLGGEWRHSEGTSYPGGPANFGTGEVEVNSRNNATVAGGNLSITARGNGLGPWTSDRIETNRQDFQPPAGGKLRVEARLRLPEAANGQSNGYWPAFWILAAPYRGNWWNWPTVGEIDIMESVSGLNRTWQTLHCGWLDPAQGPNVCNEKDGVGNGGSGPCGAGDQACTKAFHTYTMDWSRADHSMTWYVDGRQVWRVQRGVNVDTQAWDLAFLNHGFFIVMNLAIGGEMPVNNGVPLNAATTGGGHYDADYIAAYTGPANAPAPGNPTQPPTTPPGGGIPATSVIEAEAYSAQQGTQTEATADPNGGGQNVGWIANGDWLRYDNVNFGTTALRTFQGRLASGAPAGVTGQLQVRLDSVTAAPVATVPISPTGGWQNWQSLTAATTGITGNHTVFLTFTSAQAGDFVNINQFTFRA